MNNAEKSTIHHLLKITARTVKQIKLIMLFKTTKQMICLFLSCNQLTSIKLLFIFEKMCEHTKKCFRIYNEIKFSLFQNFVNAHIVPSINSSIVHIRTNFVCIVIICFNSFIKLWNIHWFWHWL